ncbi:MAG: hypothetical protein IPQ08_15015 [Chitinophagaceae bacterium]|nr:hypothetical protein [Chitinophagaceae bacterium]
MKHTLILISFITCALFSNAQGPSNEAKKYVDNVFRIIEKNYYYIDRINIKLLKDKCYALISNAKTTKETYPAIDTLLKDLFDHHHIFLRPEQFSNSSKIWPLKFPSVEVINKSVGYIKIPPIANQYNQWQLWIDSLQNSLGRLEGSTIKGWIIDLRGNYGGDLPPMITSLYPFFGDGIIYTLQDRKNNLETYSFSSGYYAIKKRRKVYKAVRYNNQIKTELNIPVAILIDIKTASAAEMVAIAFKGRAKTIFLGEPTAGLTISTRGFKLSDNAFFTIANGKFYDLKGNSYENSITPDIFIKQDSIKMDETKEKAIEWLRRQ